MKKRRQLTTGEGILVGASLLFAFLAIVALSKLYFPWYFDTMFGDAFSIIDPIWLVAIILVSILIATVSMYKRIGGGK